MVLLIQYFQILLGQHHCVLRFHFSRGIQLILELNTAYVFLKATLLRSVPPPLVENLVPLIMEVALAVRSIVPQTEGCGLYMQAVVDVIILVECRIMEVSASAYCWPRTVH